MSLRVWSTLPPDLSVGGLRDVPLVRPSEFFIRGKVKPEIIKVPCCMGRLLFRRCGPVPCRVAKRRKFDSVGKLFLPRKPVKQISVQGEKALQGRHLSISIVIRKTNGARTSALSSKPDHNEGFRNAWRWRTVSPRSRARGGAAPVFTSLITVSASGSGARADRWESYQARS